MDNVVNLKNNKQANETEKRIESPPVNVDSTDEHSVEMIKRGIKGGLSILQKQLDLWEENQKIEEADNLTYRSLTGVRSTLKNLDELVGMIQHDTVGVIQNLENQMIGQWTSQAHLQTLIETLKKNKIITEEELEQTWNEIVPKPENN